MRYLFLAALCGLMSGPASAVVSRVSVVSDQVADVSSLAGWKHSYLRDTMTDEQKAMAIWKSVVAHQYQDAPPSEYLQYEGLVLDPIKMFNVYGYSFCGVASSEVQCLARYVGLEARGWTIRAHVVPEIFYGGGWHMFDASLVNYFTREDGSVASVEDIVAAVKAWHAANPGYLGNNEKLSAFQRQDGWTGWHRGPRLLTTCPFYDAGGWWPAGTHGWSSTMQEYDGSTLFPYSSGFSQGYQVNIQLRPGERLVRNWSNKGLHVNAGGDAPGCLTGVSGRDSMRSTPRFGDLAPGRIGNGTLSFDLPLRAPDFAETCLAVDNLATEPAGSVTLKDAARPGSLVLRMPSSYVYLTGSLALDADVGAGGGVALAFSENNGLDWQPLADVTESGARTIDLTAQVLRRYDYRLRVTLRGQGTMLKGLRLSHDIQHSQRPLPALAQGQNTIHFASPAQEGTITVEGSTSPGNRGKQVLATDFHPTLEAVEPEFLRLKEGAGSVTFPVTTPGDMTRLRINGFYRARDAKDTWEIEVSFDDGKTYAPVGSVHGPTVAMTTNLPDVPAPPHTRSALVRWRGTQRNTLCLFNARIDADYAEPAGRFEPVRITYRWTEDGQPKEDVHIAKTADETYTIACPAVPTMRSITLELAR
ncbi:MAG: hypothetical protein HZB16_09455 [Armatimonadetes bacterium]|nr:hypothetical protein [Armatimonadota bacterium]